MSRAVPTLRGPLIDSRVPKHSRCAGLRLGSLDYKVPTHKGLSPAQFTKVFSGDEPAGCWSVETLWPHGVRCPCCESDNVAHVESREPQP